MAGSSVCFCMDNQMSILAVNRQGSCRSSAILNMAERIFRIAHSLNITFSASYLQGNANEWADALSHHSTFLVEWNLSPDIFTQLTLTYGTPQVDRMFHGLPVYVVRSLPSYGLHRFFHCLLVEYSISWQWCSTSDTSTLPRYGLPHRPRSTSQVRLQHCHL